MQLTKDKVATLNYTLKNKDGEIIDQSDDGTFTYLHGARNIIPGLENALEDKQAGDKTSVVIDPEEAYGERSADKVQKVSISMFPDDVELEIGMQFEAQAPDGTNGLVMVTEIKEGEVVIDGNHPMAGIQLHFDVEIVEVRDATEEELEHGHVHGPHGHEH